MLAQLAHRVHCHKVEDKILLGLEDRVAHPQPRARLRLTLKTKIADVLSWLLGTQRHAGGVYAVTLRSKDREASDVK